MRGKLLKMHLKQDGNPKNMQHVVAEAKALKSAKKANKLIMDATKGQEEQAGQNETKEGTWNLPLVLQPTQAPSLKNMPCKRENMHKVWK